ncbi:TolC family protein [bacterium]|nr:TolC family protein [bacterium]
MATLETRTLGRSKARAAAALLGALLAGCGVWQAPPDVRRAWAPEALAPPRAHESWQPSEPAAAPRPAPDASREALQAPPDPAEVYDLPALIDLALRNNPDTRAAWESARQAAAAYGRSLAPYYPTLRAEAGARPVKRNLEAVPDAPLTVHLHAFEPEIALTYTLLDFGRTAQSAERARQQLLAANFRFNRRLQDVVFATQRAFYRLDAAKGLETAADRNLDLARTVLAASEQRLAVGLATKPEVLLARQLDAQARYDVENAVVGVKNGEADLALALGVRADRPLRIEPLAAQAPETLAEAVESVIADALRDRPDLAARAAELRAAEAQVAKARADFLPTIGFRGAYGQQIWNYQAAAMSNLRANEPTYDTLFTLDWPLFTGFERANALREAEHATAAARAELAASELDAVAGVWRSYHDYRAAVRKVEFAAALLAASEDAYASTFATYKVGLSDIVELLTAARDLAAARYTVVLSRAEMLTTAAAVAYAAGAVKP